MMKEAEVRAILKKHERCLERLEKQWYEDKISDDIYSRLFDKHFEVVSVLKVILNEELEEKKGDY